MSYEDQLIREATGQNRDFCEPEPEETNESNETGNQQGETTVRCPNHWGGGATRCPRGGAALQIWQRQQ